MLDVCLDEKQLAHLVLQFSLALTRESLKSSIPTSTNKLSVLLVEAIKQEMVTRVEAMVEMP